LKRKLKLKFLCHFQLRLWVGSICSESKKEMDQIRWGGP
jgi:hypothetical protein